MRALLFLGNMLERERQRYTRGADDGHQWKETLVLVSLSKILSNLSRCDCLIVDYILEPFRGAAPFERIFLGAPSAALLPGFMSRKNGNPHGR